jgi:hypothetical protein
MIWVKVKGQRSRSKLGQVIILTKTLFFEKFNWMNFTLGVKVAHSLQNVGLFSALRVFVQV